MATEIAMLHDVSKCSGCRACMVACKQWKNLPAEMTPFTGDYQSHRELSPKTYNILFMNEYFRFGRISWQFAKYQCMCGLFNLREVLLRRKLFKQSTLHKSSDTAGATGVCYEARPKTCACTQRYNR